MLGLEVVIQVTIQILVLLLNRTDTPTTGGLETIFDGGNGRCYGNATQVLVLSVLWSIFTSIRMKAKFIFLEKGFCPTTSQLVVVAWATFATLRRILSLITVFIPPMGLFNLLHHWKWEQVPFDIRIENAKGLISYEDKISLFSLKATILWSDLDRTDYSDPQYPVPPSYAHYTLLTLQETFIVLIGLSFVQLLATWVIKVWSSKDFRKESYKTNKLIHLLENINFASPFKDWDDGDYTAQEFKKRAKAVQKEVLGTQAIHFISTVVMLVPLWYTGKEIFDDSHVQIGTHFHFLNPPTAFQIEARHIFLVTLLGKVKPEETESLETAWTLVITITTCLCVFSMMEAMFYYLFSSAVNIG